MLCNFSMQTAFVSAVEKKRVHNERTLEIIKFQRNPTWSVSPDGQ